MKIKENGMLIKCLSVLLTVLLVLEQTVWGADIIDAGYGPGKSSADEIMTGYEPGYSGERVSAKDALLENMTSAENFVNNSAGGETRLITSTGCEIYFKDDEISRVLRPDGSTVTFETIKDAGGEVTGLKLKEGPVERIYDREGDLVSEIHRSEDGEQTELIYENGVLADIRSGVMAMEDISISGSGDIESFSLMDSGGSAYFFSGGSLSSFRDANNAEYVFGADGALAWVNIKDKGESYRVKTIVSGGKETRTLTEIRKGDSYVFTDGNLISVTMSSGERAEYSYDTLERVSALKVYNRDILTDTYTYLYRGDETVITDGFGTIRSYDPSGRAIELKNCYGETYTYSYETDSSGEPVTVVNYSVKKHDNGDTLYYVRGKLMKVERPDGSVIENIELDPELGSITAFSLKTTEGKTRNIRLAGSLVIVELPDQSRLVFKSGELIAMANSQGHVILSDDPGLRDIGIFDDKPAAAEANDALVTSALWRPQTTSNSKGITHLEMDHGTGEWTVESDIVAGSADRSSGEMYLDLRYDIPGVNGGPALDLKGMEISFLVKADPSLVPAGGKPCEIEVFAKDSSWKTQYGVKAELTAIGEWFKVTLVPTQGAIGLGYTDPGFDPSSIVMIGLRLSAPGTASKGSMYRGTLTVKHDVMPDLVPGNAGNNILDDFYRELGIRRDIKRLYGDSGASEAGPLEAFVEAMRSVPEDGLGRDLLSKVVFHAENNVPHIKGIESVKFDAASGEYIAAADLSSSAYGKKEGEVYFDLTKDVPGLDWTDVVNLTGQTLRMLIKAPETLAAGGSSPNGARVFVVDENGNKQYGTWVNFKEGEVWYALDLTPTFGNVPMGSTQAGFDPSKIVRIGINIALGSGPAVEYKGDVRFKFYKTETCDDIMPVSSPLWTDMSAAFEYLKRSDGKEMCLFPAEKISSGDISKIFEPSPLKSTGPDYSAAALPNTKWQRQQGGITKVGWDSSGDALTAAVGMSSSKKTGEILLDLRYSCWVPGKTWANNQPLDFRGKTIEFYVRTVPGYSLSGPGTIAMEAFVKDSPSWRTEYGEKIYLENSGEWQKVILTPCPPAENKGYVVSGFDPSKVIAIGLRLTSSGGAAYNGPLEIRYAINDLEGYGSGSALENIPVSGGPVWVDQRAVSGYLLKKGIDLCLDGQVSEEISGIAPLLSTYILSGSMTVTAVYDKNGNITSVMKADGTTSLLDASGRVTRVISEEGAVFAENVYSSSGEFERTVLSGARERLAAGMGSAALEVERRASDALLLLSEEKKIIEEDFMEKVMLARADFAASRQEIEAQRYVEIEHKVLWWTWTEKVERPGVDEAISSINRQEAVFEAEVRSELEKLGGLYDARMNVVLAEKDRVLEEYAVQGETVMKAILCREALPAINREYRDILGRDASENEVKAIFERITEFNVFGLKADLLASEEYASSERFRAQVISGVTALLSGFIPGGVSGGIRSSILKGLGISPDENVIDVDAAYVDKVVLWLKGLDNHFGKSAFGALREFLAASGKAADLSELCVKTIAADLLLGVIVPAASNSLAISMHTVSLIAAAYGVVAQSARITRDEAARLKKPFMTLIDGDHYVTVLSISSGKVVYWDNNYGRSGGEVTVNSDDFFRGWQGNVITSDKVEASRILSVSAAKRIKGAFFNLIFAAAYSISVIIASVVTTAITAITTIAAPLISAISAVINAVVGGIAAAVEGLKISLSGLLGNMGVALGAPAQLESFIAPLADAAIYGSTTGLDLSAVSGVFTVSELPTFTLGYAADTACGFFTSAAVSSTVASAGGFNAASLAGPCIAAISSGLLAKGILAMQTLPAVGNAVKLKITPGDLLKSSPRDLASQFASFGVELVEADDALQEIIARENEVKSALSELNDLSFNSEERSDKNSFIENGKMLFISGKNLSFRMIENYQEPEIIRDSRGVCANIDLNVKWPGSTSLTSVIIDVGQVFAGNSAVLNNDALTVVSASDRWDMSTSLDAQARAKLFNEGYRFVYGGGINTDGLTNQDSVGKYDFELLYDKLGGKHRISVGFSASSVGALKYMGMESELVVLEKRAEFHVFISPQFTPEELIQQMKKSGISSDKVIVVETQGDMRKVPGGDFADNLNSDDSLKWNHVKLIKGDGVSDWNSFSSHKAAIEGLLNGETFDIIDNGEFKEKISLEQVLKTIINGRNQ